jgi:polyhydroxyalkanoate synthesis regulator protein
MEWFEQAMRMFSPFGAAAAATTAAAADRAAGRPGEPEKTRPGEKPPEEKPQGEKPAADLSQDLDQLQRQLGEMQAQLQRLTRGKG